MEYTRKKYKENSIEIQLSTFQPKGGIAECHALISVLDPALSYEQQVESIVSAYADWMRENMDEKAIPAFRRYFLSDVANQAEDVFALERTLATAAVSVVQQPPLNGTKIALWVYLQAEVEVQNFHTHLMGYSRNGYHHLWSGGMYNKAANSEYQTRLLLNDYILLLTGQHCSLAANCIRTWLFVQNVDVNYAGVVKARKEVFFTQGLAEDTHYITSTGIEGRHYLPDVFVQMDAYAVYGLQPEQIQYLYARTHLNPTYEYGVTFERGVAVSYGDRKQLYLSGTASINNRGDIVHPSHVIRQADRMMENISVLLQEGGGTIADIVQSLIYLRDTADYQQVKEYFETRYPTLPYLILLAPVCRPGWLIEMECIAEIETAQPAFSVF